MNALKHPKPYILDPKPLKLQLTILIHEIYADAQENRSLPSLSCACADLAPGIVMGVLPVALLP